MWAADLLAVFGASPQWPQAASERYVPMLRAAGLTIVQVEDWHGKLRFTDVGAIVYYLRAVPWLVPGFSIEKFQNELLGLQARIESGDSLVFDAGTYLIVAQK